MDELYDDYAGVCMGCDNTLSQCDCDGKDDEEYEEDTECICNNCMEEDNILPNGYCEDCYDQGCDEDEELH